jgi:multiple sugar transport system permease protein
MIRRRVVLSLLPLFGVVLLVYLLPICSTVVNAFLGHAGASDGQFVGLGNFTKIKDSIPGTLLTTLIWTFGSVFPAALLGLVMALLFQHDFRMKRLLMSINLLPYSIPLIIVASCWMFMYNQDFGILNVSLMQAGIIQSPIKFLSYDNALASVIVVRIWRALPFAFINFYAALTTIPMELYEAADVDGATSTQAIWYITLPNLRPVIATTLIILTVWTFLVFDIIYGMTGGGPVDATRIISIQIYRELFQMKDLGIASAWSLIAIGALLVISSCYWKLLSSERRHGR